MKRPHATDNALLQQAQQSFIKLAGIATDDIPLFKTLIQQLFVAQQTGNGVLPIATVEQQLAMTIDELTTRANGLIGDTHQRTPIVVFSDFIALRRAYLQLAQVQDELLSRRETVVFSANAVDALSKMTWDIGNEQQLSDEQKLAVLSAASQRFSLITGGAGTGKTTTLTKALELMLHNNPEATIALAAPTGKAAQRLNESLSAQLQHVGERVRAKLADCQATTLHRLLAINETTGHAYKNAHNPLLCDILAIDEASMVGSDLLVQVFDALRPNTQLILLGDANQLPPINAVAFFNEVSRLEPLYTPAFAHMAHTHLGVTIPQAQLLDTPEDQQDQQRQDNVPALTNQIGRLLLPKRFAEQSFIERAANATLNNDAEALITALGEALLPLPEKIACYQQLAQRTIGEDYAALSQALLSSTIPSMHDNERDSENYKTRDNRGAPLPHGSDWVQYVTQRLTQRKILCANRQGELGSEAINAYLDSYFRRLANTLSKGQGRAQAHRDRSLWYEGRQILIEKNNSDLQLSNGDIGQCIWCDSDGHGDISDTGKNSGDNSGHDGGWCVDFGEGRVLPVTQLPYDYSLAFAITIHKSQGSEYAHVDIVLDRFDAEQADAVNPLITRALLYTAITRAKDTLTIFSDKEVITQAFQQTASVQSAPLQQLLSQRAPTSTI